jgi:hypothetical protein
MNLEGLTKTAGRNAGDEKLQTRASRNVPVWRGATTPHGDVFPNLHVVIVVIVVVVVAAAAAVESLRVKAGRASALGRHHRLKPYGRYLRAKPSRREPV